MDSRITLMPVYDFLRQKYPALETDYGLKLEDVGENFLERLMSGEHPAKLFGKPKKSLIETTNQMEELITRKLEDSGQQRGVGSRTTRIPKTTSYKTNPRDSNISSINYHG